MIQKDYHREVFCILLKIVIIQNNTLPWLTVFFIIFLIIPKNVLK